jgi:hypothetical protein
VLDIIVLSVGLLIICTAYTISVLLRGRGQTQVPSTPIGGDVDPSSGHEGESPVSSNSLLPDEPTSRSGAGRGCRRVFFAAAAIPAGLIGLLCIIFFATSCSRPQRYEIPAGYEGWFVVYYESPNCAPMRNSGVWRVISVDSMGIGCTSDPMPLGWKFDRYEYVNADGTRTEIPHGPPGYGAGAAARSPSPPGIHVLPLSTSSDHRAETTFVGTAALLEKSWSAQPRPGPIIPARRVP